MYGGTVKVAKSRKTKRKPLTEAEYLEEASEQPARKAKKAKKEKAAKATSSGLQTIQEEVKDLGHTKVIGKGPEVVRKLHLHHLSLLNLLLQEGQGNQLLGS